MTIYDPYKDPDRAPTTIGTAHLTRSVRGGSTDPGAGDVGGPIHNSTPGSHHQQAYGHGQTRASRSPILTALVSFVSLSIVPVTIVVAMLVWLNQELCAEGLATIQCQGVDATVRGLVATGITGFSALVVSMIGGGRVKRARNTAGLVLVTLAIAAMAILIAWLRQNLGIPFPF